MNIVFFGSPNFAVPFLQHLTDNPDINVQAVITQPDKAAGRKKELVSPPVKLFASKKGIPVLQPPALKNNTELKTLLENLNPDFFVVIAYGKLLPEDFLQIPAHGAINVHASILPKYRGASPIQSSILNDEKFSGISIMGLTKDMDAGDIYYIRKIPIDGKENAHQLAEKLAEIGSLVLPVCLKDIKDKILTPIPQNHEAATYCEKIKKEDGQIDPAKETAKEIYNKFRAFYPWPGIFLIFNKKRLKILKLDPAADPTADPVADPAAKIYKIEPGKFKVEDGGLFLGTKKGSLKINRLQFEGKKPIQAKDFINGFLKK